MPDRYSGTEYGGGYVMIVGIQHEEQRRLMGLSPVL